MILDATKEEKIDPVEAKPVFVHTHTNNKRKENMRNTMLHTVLLGDRESCDGITLYDIDL